MRDSHERETECMVGISRMILLPAALAIANHTDGETGGTGYGGRG